MLVVVVVTAPTNSVPAVVSSLPSGDFLVYDPRLELYNLAGSELTPGIGV